MGVIRFRPASALAAALVALSIARPAVADRAPLRDAPVCWVVDDRGDMPKPKKRDPNLLHDGIDQAFLLPLGRLLNPARLPRRVGTLFGGDHVRAASDVNSLDEVPNSAWFTNRIGLYPLTAAEVARGPAQADAPDRSVPWTVTSAKVQGVTPGFNIRDARGDVYLIKFDPACCPGMSSAAGVITGRLLHAAGYNVPEDYVVTFRREDLLLGDDVWIKEPNGKRHLMTAADLDGILSKVATQEDGTWRAIASRFLKGTPVGPFSWGGRRKDDPFDTMRHQHRRVLRGLRVVSAWLDHFDTKQLNTLDMYVEESGRKHIRHYLIDFASTLGAGATGPYPKANYEYAVDFPASLGRAVSLGLFQSPWERIRRPEGLEEIGYLESREFDPSKWKPLNPNAAFANLTDRDGYWAAKIVSAFTRPQLEAAVSEGKYRNPEAARFVVRLLEERRDKVARHWFDRVAPLDFFTVEGATLRFHDLGAERGIYPGTSSRYRARASAVGPDRDGTSWSGWIERSEPTVSLDSFTAAQPLASAAEERYPFLAVQAQVNRGTKWSPSVTVYVARASGRVVALDR